MGKSIQKSLADAAAKSAANTAKANPGHGRMQEIARQLAQKAAKTK